MLAVVLHQVVASLPRLQSIHTLILNYPHVVQAHDYACFFWKRSEFRNKQAKSDTLLLLEITQSAHHFELVIDEFGLLTHTHKDATDVDFLACAAPVID